MPNSILSSLVSKVSMLVINELTGETLWKKLKIANVEYALSSENTDDPISSEQLSESSVYISLLTADIKTSKIINPTAMRITCFTDDISTLESVIRSFTDTQQTLSITSKSIIAKAMTLTDVEISQSHEMLSASRLVLSLEQCDAPTNGEAYTPKQSGDESVYGVGVQTLKSLTQSATDLYNKVSTQIGALL